MPYSSVPVALIIHLMTRWMRQPTLHGVPAGRKRKWVRAIGSANIGNLALKISKGMMDYEQYRGIAWSMSSVNRLAFSVPGHEDSFIGPVKPRDTKPPRRVYYCEHCGSPFVN